MNLLTLKVNIKIPFFFLNLLCTFLKVSYEFKQAHIKIFTIPNKKLCKLVLCSPKFLHPDNVIKEFIYLFTLKNGKFFTFFWLTISLTQTYS